MRGLLIIQILFFLNSAQALVCSNIFNSLDSDKIVEGFNSAQTIKSLLSYSERAEGLGFKIPLLSPEQKDFIKNNEISLEGILEKENLSVHELLNLKVFSINNDPNFKEDHLQVIVLGPKSLYFRSKNPSRIDPDKKGFVWHKITSQTVGFMRRPNLKLILNDAQMLWITSDAKIAIVKRHEKDSEKLSSLIEQLNPNDKKRQFILEYQAEIDQALKQTSLTLTELMQGEIVEGVIQETQGEIFFINSAGGSIYFTPHRQAIDDSNHNRWGVLEEPSIGFAKGKELTIHTKTGMLLKLKSGNVESYLLNAEQHFEDLIASADPQGGMINFLVEFKPEIIELIEKKIIDLSDFYSQNLMQAKSQKTGDEFFVLEKSEKELIYFVKDADKFNNTGKKWRYLTSLDEKKQGNRYLIGYLDVEFYYPPGFRSEKSLRSEINFTRYQNYLKSQQQDQ